MNVPSPHEFSKELLAAYADGELDANGRALVERWLADHPEELAELRNQHEFSATNALLWNAAEPPEPSASAWAGVRKEIELELSPTYPKARGRSQGPRRARWLLVAGLTMSGAAATILWLAFASSFQPSTSEHRQPVEQANNTEPRPEVAPEPRIVSPPADPLAEFAVLPMATDDDVVLDRVPDFRDGWLPVGQHPVPGIVALAMVEEFVLEEENPPPARPVNGRSKMTAAPGDAPMIFAAKHR
jgi:anti-sigma factor RsiW